MTAKSEAISVFMGRFPAIKITAPNSPSERAKAMVVPIRKAGRIAGKITLVKIWNGVAPSVRAASSWPGSRSSRIGWTVRTTKGIEVKDIAIAMPQIV